MKKSWEINYWKNFNLSFRACEESIYNFKLLSDSSQARNDTAFNSSIKNAEMKKLFSETIN